MSTTVVVAFNADHESLGISYGHPCKHAFLTAASEFLPDDGPPPRLLYGDLLLHNEAYVPVAVRTSESPQARTTQIEMHPSPERYEAVLWEFTLGIEPSWLGLSISKLPFFLSRHRIYLLGLCQLHQDALLPIWERLSVFDPAIGAFAVDEGHPLVREQVYGSLIAEIAVTRQSLLVSVPLLAEVEDVLALPSEVAEELGLESKAVPEDDFNEIVHPIPEAAPLSENGSRFKRVWQKKLRADHAHRVLQELEEKAHAGELVDFSIGSEGTEHHLHIDPRKLRDYALNPEHEKGGASKARVFESALGITRADHSYLAREIVSGMQNVQLREVRKSEHGHIQYHADVVVTGLNGRRCEVRTVWKTSTGSKTSLVTAYIDEAVAENHAGPTLFIPKGAMSHEERWDEIVTLAKVVAERAAEEVVPTPMVVVSDTLVDGQIVEKEYPPDLEGDCGFAWVVIPDGRSAFAHWLKKTGLGSNRHPAGVSIWASHPSQSVARARAYAEAFADVLQRHDIECSVEWRYD